MWAVFVQRQHPHPLGLLPGWAAEGPAFHGGRGFGVQSEAGGGDGAA